MVTLVLAFLAIAFVVLVGGFALVAIIGGVQRKGPFGIGVVVFCVLLGALIGWLTR